MTMRQELEIEGNCYPVVISDDSEALLAACAAGSAVVGLWHPGTDQDLSMVRFLIERPEDADIKFLDKVIRRTHGLPLIIAETERLLIREFCLADWKQVPAEPEDQAADRTFYNQEQLEAYIQCQYGFYEYGLWALEEKGSGRLIGKAGPTGPAVLPGREDTGLEFGYHIFLPFRRQGFAVEACQAVLSYIRQEIESPFICIKTDASNEASAMLALRLGFTESECSEAGIRHFLA